ncbi:MAG TPA: cytochrome C oxidase subunit IV family protein [Actinomycetota bacterium]|nr:cytochrome C oxidase subunit IV family protein [Actinomycetota bacterium]
MTTETPLDEHAADHPSEFQYVKVAVFLAIVTALEVAVFYIPALENLIIPILSAMMLIKFIAVAGYFMHLKFDSRIFRRFFVLGIILAMAIYGVVLWTFTFADRLPGAS